ncbi:MAG: hypothetical protein JO323_16995 [Acidobacteriia bacterium]|nr:hypothetical protein [Terriglobia bacterium]
METISEKQHAHELLERLPPSQMATVIRFLEFMLLDPVARAVVTAPPDDEPVTEQDRRRFHEGQTWFGQRGGKGISMADVLAEFDLTAEDLPQPPDDMP